MMKILLNLFLLFSIIELYGQTWTQLADFPGIERDDACSFTINNITYCGTGVVPYYTLRDFYSFDMSNEKWNTISSMPDGEQRQYAAAFSYDGLGYVFGGYNNGYLSDLWQYNPKTDLWVKKASLPAQGRSGSAYFVIGHTAYIVGGKTDSAAAISEVWAYDMQQDSWQQKNDFPFGRRWRTSAATVDSFAYLIFGLDKDLNYQSGLYEYNSAKDQWAKKSDFPNGGRNYSTLQAMNKKLFIVGGEDSSSNFYNDIWSFDLSKEEWMALDSIPAEGRRGGICFHNKNTIFYTTGLAADKSRFRETWKWSQTTSINENNISKNFSIYPNPTSSNINIEFIPYNAALEPKYFIYDNQGRLIRHGKLKSSETSVILEGFPQALYIVKLQTKSGVLVKKVVKR